MKVDDPRHGTEAGCREHYRDGEKPCDPCQRAHARRNKLRRLYPHKRPAIGSQRRIQALQAIGYGRHRIAQELGYTHAGALSYLMQADSLLATTAERIADVYDRLCMTIPEGAGPNRARTWAKRNGFRPPLVWDNIDDPGEQPTDWEYRAPNVFNAYADSNVDPVVVRRLLEGDRIPSTRVEKEAAMERWRADGNSERELCLVHGWKPGRYGRLRAVEEAS